MTVLVRVPTSDDIATDADLARYIRAHMQIVNRLGYEYALMGAALRAMLKDADKAAQRNRRGRVARPLSMAAGTMILASRQLALVDRRFRESYAAEQQASRRRSQRRSQMGFAA